MNKVSKERSAAKRQLTEDHRQRISQGLRKPEVRTKQREHQLRRSALARRAKAAEAYALQLADLLEAAGSEIPDYPEGDLRALVQGHVTDA